MAIGDLHVVSGSESSSSETDTDIRPANPGEVWKVIGFSANVDGNNDADYVRLISYNDDDATEIELMEANGGDSDNPILLFGCFTINPEWDGGTSSSAGRQRFTYSRFINNANLSDNQEQIAALRGPLYVSRDYYLKFRKNTSNARNRYWYFLCIETKEAD